jgi:SAM-dependent methyltransferase
MEAAVYDAFFRAEDVHWWFRARRRVLATVLERLGGAPPLDIADIGCGTGGMLALLGRFGRVTGVDASPAAREYCARRGFQGVLSPEEWERMEDRYDLITAFDVVEHVEDDIGFLAGLRARLRPDGALLVTVPAYPFLWSPFDEMNHHKRRYTGGSLRRALSAAGLRVDRISYFNGLLLPAVVVSRILERIRGRPLDTPQDQERAIRDWFRVGPMNGVLEGVFAAERHWLRRGSLPAGSSILALAGDGTRA